MSKLKEIRNRQNLTQEQLSEMSGISVRTIQRLEAGTQPKGFTLKTLADALGVKESEFMEHPQQPVAINIIWLKIFNISSLPFALLPPLNIVVPLLLMAAKKQYHPLAKQLVTIQIVWTIASFILFMLTAFMKNWLPFGSKLMIPVMIVLVLSNFFIILRNAYEIDQKGTLFIRLKFSIV